MSKIFVQSTHDQYGPLSELEPLVASLAEPKKLVLVEAAGPFFRRSARGIGARNRRPGSCEPASSYAPPAPNQPQPNQRHARQPKVAGSGTAEGETESDVTFTPSLL